MAKNKDISLNGGQDLTAQQKLEAKKKKKKRKVARIVVLSVVGTLILLMGSCIYLATIPWNILSFQDPPYFAASRARSISTAPANACITIR